MRGHALADVHWHAENIPEHSRWCLICACGRHAWAGQCDMPTPVRAWEIHQRHLAVVTADALEAIAASLETLAAR